jgi:MFS family permease
LPDKEESEYLDNWVEKFHMLCQPKQKVGMLGSAYFFGILVGLLIVPRISDKYGRKAPFLGTMLLSFVA